MQDTRVYDYMIRSGTLRCRWAGSAKEIPVSVGVPPRADEVSAHCVLSAARGGLRAEVILRNDTGLPVGIDALSLDTTVLLPPGTPVFCNGYQSWSRSGMADPLRGLRGPSLFCPKFLRSSGDYPFARYSAKEAHSWTYTYFTGPLGYTLIASLDESVAFTKLAFTRGDAKKGATVRISKDCEGLFFDPVAKVSGSGPGEMKVLDVFLTSGEETDCWDRYFALFYSLQEDGLRFNRSRPAFAWDSSCAMPAADDDEAVMGILREYRDFGVLPEYFILGSEYAAGFGDWTAGGERFRGGMKGAAGRIRSFGCRPGVTFAPFLCSSSSQLFRERRELLVKDRRGSPLCVGRSRALGGRLYLLDLYNPEGEKYLRRCVRTFIAEWGMEFIRADMLFAAGLHSGAAVRRTRAQAMDHAMRLLRECAGDIPLAAGGAPLGSCFGLAEYCSVAPDLSDDWLGRPAGLCGDAVRERGSTFHAIKTAAARWHLGSRAFSADPGCFSLRKYHCRLSPEEQDDLFTACRVLGGLLCGSDSIGAYGAETLEKFRSALAERPLRRYDKKILRVWVREGMVTVTYVLNGVRREESFSLLTDLSL